MFQVSAIGVNLASFFALIPKAGCCEPLGAFAASKTGQEEFNKAQDLSKKLLALDTEAQFCLKSSNAVFGCVWCVG